MLRTNENILSYIQQLYERQERKENIAARSFSKGQLLLRQGEKPTRVLVVKEGIIKCFITEENGKDYIIEFLGKGEIIGEIEVIRNIHYLCNIQALTEVEAFSITVPFFKELLGRQPDFNSLLLDEMAERIINTSSRASFQQLHPIEHVLTKLLQLQSRQKIFISKEDMAAYLGLPNEV